jgi:hypothetical protein
VQHARELDVGRVRRLSARALRAVDPWDTAADVRERPGRPLVERVLVDDDPLLGVAALDFLFGPDQPCHDVIASSIFGYVPQRQRFPAIACRISSLVGDGFAATSAEAETI